MTPPVRERAAAAAGPRPPARRGRSGPRRRSSRQSPDAARARQLAAVRGRQQAALAGDGEGPVEVAGQARAARRWRARSRRPPVRVPRGEPGQRPGVQRVLHPVGRDHDPRSRSRCSRARCRDRVQDDLQGRDQPAEPRGVRRSGRPGSPASPSRPRRRPRRPRAPAAGCPRARAGRTGRCRTAAGSGTSRARRSPAAGAAQPPVSASGSRTPYLSASSSRVAGRIEPVKCRCRWALGSSAYVALHSRILPHVRLRIAVAGSLIVVLLALRTKWPPGRSRRRLTHSGRADQSRRLGQQLLEPADALDEVLVAQRVGQPQVAGRAEGLARDDGDLGLVQDQRGELDARSAGACRGSPCRAAPSPTGRRRTRPRARGRPRRRSR